MNAWYANWFINFAPTGADAPQNDPKFWIVIFGVSLVAIIWTAITDKS